MILWKQPSKLSTSETYWAFFWSILTQLVNNNDFQATSRDDLVQSIKNCFKKMLKSSNRRWTKYPKKQTEILNSLQLVLNLGTLSFCYNNSVFCVLIWQFIILTFFLILLLLTIAYMFLSEQMDFLTYIRLAHVDIIFRVVPSSPTTVADEIVFWKTPTLLGATSFIIHPMNYSFRYSKVYFQIQNGTIRSPNHMLKKDMCKSKTIVAGFLEKRLKSDYGVFEGCDHSFVVLMWPFLEKASNMVFENTLGYCFVRRPIRFYKIKYKNAGKVSLHCQNRPLRGSVLFLL